MTDILRKTMMRLMLALGLVAAALQIIAPAAAAAPDGWLAGPEADAVIEIGQRFDCSGEGCPPDLSCIYALGPPRPPGSWPIDTGFMLDEKRMPWSDFEAWLVAKAKALRPELADDPLVRSDRFASRTAPEAVEIAGSEFVTRRYEIAAKRRSFDLSVYLWSVKGRLRITACIAPETGSTLRAAAPAVESLLSYLRGKDPAPANE